MNKTELLNFKKAVRAQLRARQDQGEAPEVGDVIMDELTRTKLYQDFLILPELYEAAKRMWEKFFVRGECFGSPTHAMNLWHEDPTGFEKWILAEDDEDIPDLQQTYTRKALS